MTSDKFSRREFLRHGAGGAVALTGLAGILRAEHAPAAVVSDTLRPVTSWGLQIGDVVADRAIIWSRTDRAAQMLVEWSLDERFARTTRVRAPKALDSSDFTARVDLSGLPAGAEVFVRVAFEAEGARSESLTGRFRTPAARQSAIRFVWTGDTVGQGWGIDPAFGGMKIYEAMRQVQPHFFIHSGDTIYADGPLQETVTNASGVVIWRNAHLDAVPEKRKVAETLHEFRRHQLYNRYDISNRSFSAEVPQIWQWDDHEVVNNWSADKVLDERYKERNVRTLAAHTKRAFLEYGPMRWHGGAEQQLIYRRLPYNEDLDVFVIDMRSFRGPNSYNRQESPADATAFLGRTQLDWLQQQLRRSKATWKVIAADMPIGLLVDDGVDGQGRRKFEGVSNGDGPILGREFEIANLLRFIKRESINNVVWLTADVHYCAAHYYDPGKAQMQDFEPFWEFVAGPMHAGSFGPGTLDNTFGPQLMFQKFPPVQNTPPNGGYQFFGQVDIDRQSKDLTVALKDSDGATVFSKRLSAAV